MILYYKYNTFPANHQPSITNPPSLSPPSPAPSPIADSSAPVSGCGNIGVHFARAHAPSPGNGRTPSGGRWRRHGSDSSRRLPSGWLGLNFDSVWRLIPKNTEASRTEDRPQRSKMRYTSKDATRIQGFRSELCGSIITSQGGNLSMVKR